MSTVPKRTGSVESRSKSRASFKYGWRDVARKQPDGSIDFVQIPLTLEDVLHPKFGDVHLLSDLHGDDCNYLKYVLKDRYRVDLSVAVFSDCGIYWDKPGLNHHSPDLAVLFGVKRQKDWTTFHVKTEKVRPSLIIEVTSPRTRVNDVETKVMHYACASVPYYVIADAAEDKHRRLSLISYKLEGEAYQKQALDDKGRAWLEPVGLWLAVTHNPVTGGERLALVDPATGEEIGDYTAMSRLRAEAEARAEAAVQSRAEAEARAQAAEERLRQVEDELRRVRERES
jgi:Uma2 family endonuclease